MKHIEEETLEQFILHPEGMDAKTEQGLRAHLDHCPVCTRTVEFLRSFYADLNTLRYVPGERVDRFVRALFQAPNIIPLHPFVYQPDAEPFDSGYTTILAAMSVETARQRFETVATLFSGREKILVQVMHDRESDSFKLYVQSDDPRKRSYSIVSLPELPIELVTDQRGHVSFSLREDLRPKNWSSLNAVLHTPIAEVSLSERELHSPIERRTESGHVLSLSLVNGVLTVDVDSPEPRGPKVTRVLLSSEETQSRLVMLHDETNRCAINDVPEMFVLRLYC